jgi:hypothetical protein
VLDSVSSPITRRVYNLGLDEFFAWFGKEPRQGFTKATVSAWRVALEARGLDSISINMRVTALRKAGSRGRWQRMAGTRTGCRDRAHQRRKIQRCPLGELAFNAAGPGALEHAGCYDEKGLRDRAILAVVKNDS